MSDEFDVIDELGRPVHMPPRSSREVVIVTPEHIAALEAEIARLQGEQYLPGTPHSGPRACPMWYDRCLCTVGGLQFNIERAEKAEAEVARLREAGKDALSTMELLDLSAIYDPILFTLVVNTCLLLRAALEPAP